jgi:hypothetical protein
VILARGVAEVGRERVFGGEDVLAGADLDGAITACSTDEFLDAPTGLVLDPVADGQCGEHNAQVRLDGISRLWW